MSSTGMVVCISSSVKEEERLRMKPSIPLPRNEKSMTPSAPFSAVRVMPIPSLSMFAMSKVESSVCILSASGTTTVAS